MMAASKHIECSRLALALRYDPMLNANHFAGVWIGPAGNVAGCEDTGNTCFEVFIHRDTPVDGQPGLLRQGKCRPGAFATNS